MGSINICLLQDGTLYGVNLYLSFTRNGVLWGQFVLLCLQEIVLYGVNKYIVEKVYLGEGSIIILGVPRLLTLQ